MGIEIFRDSKKEWRFRVKSKNGKILCQSEGYNRKEGAMKGLEALDEIMFVNDVPEDVEVIE